VHKLIYFITVRGLSVPPTIAQLQLTQIVNKAPVALTLVSADSSTVSGQIAVVNAAQKGTMSAPTGNITIFDGGSVVAVDVVGATGTVTLATSSLSAGEHLLTAAYGGDSNFLPATTVQNLSLFTGATSATVPPPTADFAITVDQPTATVKQGEAWTANAIVTSKNGFTGTVNFSCGAMPVKMTCGFGSTFLIGQPKPISTTVTMNTAATTLATLSGLLLIGFRTRLKLLPSRLSRRSVALGFILSCVVLAVTGCAVSMLYQQTDGTPKGIYNVQVVGTSGSLVHSQTVIITVN
jgi:hypothetical protein